MKCTNCGASYNKQETTELFESDISGFCYDKLRAALCLDCAKEQFKEILSAGIFECEKCGDEFDLKTEYQKFAAECEGGEYDPNAYKIFAERAVCWECSKSTELDD